VGVLARGGRGGEGNNNVEEWALSWLNEGVSLVVGSGVSFLDEILREEESEGPKGGHTVLLGYTLDCLWNF
jgi:hypothetical protein